MAAILCDGPLELLVGGVVCPSHQPPSTSQSALAKSGVQDQCSFVVVVISRNASKLGIHVPA